MPKQILYLTKIDSIYYFLCKKDKILLPIQISPNKGGPESFPTIYNSLVRILRALEAQVLEIKIYLVQNGIFYTYLVVKTQEKILEINIKVEDALEIMNETHPTITVEEDLLNECGIKITKEMIETALIA